MFTRRVLVVAALLLVAAASVGQVGPLSSLEATLTASDAGNGSLFGYAVAVSGDTAVVGAYGKNNGSGAAYVFVRTGTSWSQQACLEASNAEANDKFGWTVAVSGDTVAVGAEYEDSDATGVNSDQADNSATDSGAAYVFVRSGTSWSQQAYLKASNTGTGDRFGGSVAVSGDTVVVGAQSEASSATGVNGDQADNSYTDSGAAYVFVRSGTSWSQQAYLKALNTGNDDRFGISVAASGDTVVVGAYHEASNATGVNGDESNNSIDDSGAAYVFVRNGTTWSQQAYLKASNTDMTFELFGHSVSVSGNTLVVGASHEDSSATGVNGDQSNNSAADSGAAYVFVRNGSSWFQQAYLKASNTGAGDKFGQSVSVTGDIVVVGAWGEASNTTGVNGDQSDNSSFGAGAAYIFVRSGTNWSQTAYLKPSIAAAGDWFGIAVSVSANSALVGVFQDDNDGGIDAGSAVAFHLVWIGSWANLGGGLSGTAGVPLLSGIGYLVEGSPVTMSLLQARSFSLAPLVVGLSNLSAPFKGGVLVPYPNYIFPAFTDFFGKSTFGGLWPPGVPAGFTTYFQWWIQDPAGPQGFAASNALSATTP